MKRSDAAPTMKDVAREAGVALGTVSKVFNGLPVGESYRARVEEAAARLGYQVNSYARGLKTKQSHMVALLLPDIAVPCCAAFAEELCKALARRDYRMLLALTHGDAGEELRNIRLLERHSVDGIIGICCAPEAEGGDRVPFVRICDLDDGERSAQVLARLAENCVDLLLWEGDGEAAQVCVDGVTIVRSAGPRA